ncbi:Conserved hypothetical protein [Xanthomonas translucens pv. translucens DSM 18974]|uniref:Uncharacterized protein n=1 Tax=Xanthomonas translucens pv. translucens DSM 18974 TaxID=1261556 RepID=A0A1C3TRF3_XANCT|nr:hypothetical protein BN444_03255 [Xanthomonas translucens pv. translucens DSM 18974]SCB05818.1 Conserved hypothetical protein [Xanthomonas translucens pv. translucens DSM 18974]
METTLEVRFYRSASGAEPVRPWLREEVSAEARRTIGGDMKTVQLGWPLGMPLVRKMDHRLWEVRSTPPVGFVQAFAVDGGSQLAPGLARPDRTVAGDIRQRPAQLAIPGHQPGRGGHAVALHRCRLYWRAHHQQTRKNQRRRYVAHSYSQAKTKTAVPMRPRRVEALQNLPAQHYSAPCGNIATGSAESPWKQSTTASSRAYRHPPRCRQHRWKIATASAATCRVATKPGGGGSKNRIGGTKCGSPTVNGDRSRRHGQWPCRTWRCHRCSGCDRVRRPCLSPVQSNEVRDTPARSTQQRPAKPCHQPRVMTQQLASMH